MNFSKNFIKFKNIKCHIKFSKHIKFRNKEFNIVSTSKNFRLCCQVININIVRPFINVIHKSQFDNGIPPVMGSHLMPSNKPSPISKSKNTETGVLQHIFKYPENDTHCAILQYPDSEAVSKGLIDMILNKAKISIQEKGSFTFVVSGGSVLPLLNGLTKTEANWEYWHIFWVDERIVPHSSPDSNYKATLDSFLSVVEIPDDNIYQIQEGLDVYQAAKNYEGRLLSIDTKILPRNSQGFPCFDLILMGIGPDGHVASLFPNKIETSITEGWIIPVTNSPKLPKERFSFTIPVINSAKEITIVAVGSNKSEIVQRVLEVTSLPGALPAQLICPKNGSLNWVLDKEASEKLNILKWKSAKEYPRNAY